MPWPPNVARTPKAPFCAERMPSAETGLAAGFTSACLSPVLEGGLLAYGLSLGWLAGLVVPEPGVTGVISVPISCANAIELIVTSTATHSRFTAFLQRGFSFAR